MRKKKKKISTIYLPKGKIIDAIPLKGQNGKRTVKMQPRRGSLKESEKIILGHIKEGRLNHLNGYQKISGKITKYKVSARSTSYRSIPLTKNPLMLHSGEEFLGIYGEPLPSSIIVSKNDSMTEVYSPNISSFVSGTTIYVGSIDIFPIL